MSPETKLHPYYLAELHFLSSYFFLSQKNQQIHDTPTTAWSTARAECKGRGADLAIIKSEEENEFIFDLLKKQYTAKMIGAWIGMKTNVTDKKVYWLDSTEVDGGYTAWVSEDLGELLEIENCGYIIVTEELRDLAGKWAVASCKLNGSADLVILCEKSI